jgi:hypothetical protein
MNSAKREVDSSRILCIRQELKGTTRELAEKPNAGGPVNDCEEVRNIRRSCAPFIAFFAMSGRGNSSRKMNDDAFPLKTPSHPGHAF